MEFGVGETTDLTDTRARERAVGIVLDRSISRLDETTRQRFFDLAIFPEDTPIPTPVLADLWHTDTNHTCRDLRRRSLIQRADLTSHGGTVRLHDVLRGHLRHRPDVAPTLPHRHQRLLDAYRPASGGWAELPIPADTATDGPDGSDALTYLWRHLGGHLTSADLTGELATTVTTATWLARAYMINGPAAVEHDLKLSGPDHLGLLRRWRQSASTLAPLASAEPLTDAIVGPSRSRHYQHLGRPAHTPHRPAARTPVAPARHPERRAPSPTRRPHPRGLVGGVVTGRDPPGVSQQRSQCAGMGSGRRSS